MGIPMGHRIHLWRQPHAHRRSRGGRDRHRRLRPHRAPALGHLLDRGARS